MPTLAHRLFSAAPSHPANHIVYRTRFRNVVGLLFAYRFVGTIAAAVAYAAETPGSRAAGGLLVVAGGYAVVALVIAYRTAQLEVTIGEVPILRVLPIARQRRGQTYRFGMGRHGWLRSPLAVVADLAVALVLNVLLVLGTPTTLGVYGSFSDLFAVANITTVALWAGCWGARAGMVPFVVVTAVEVVKGPLSSMSVDWPVIVSRSLWVACGYLAALGVTRNLWGTTSYIVASQEDRESLRSVRVLHDDYKVALLRVARALDGSDPDVGEAYAAATAALGEGEKETLGRFSETSIEHAANWAVLEARRHNQRMTFYILNRSNRDVRLRDIEPLRSTLRNLCNNAAKYNEAPQVTISWTVGHGELVVTVADSTVHHPRPDGHNGPFEGKGGSNLSRRNIVDEYGGLIEPVRVPARDGGWQWKWKILIPESAIESTHAVEVQ